MQAHAGTKSGVLRPKASENISSRFRHLRRGKSGHRDRARREITGAVMLQAGGG